MTFEVANGARQNYYSSRKLSADFEAAYLKMQIWEMLKTVFHQNLYRSSAQINEHVGKFLHQNSKIHPSFRRTTMTEFSKIPISKVRLCEIVSTNTHHYSSSPFNAKHIDQDPDRNSKTITSYGRLKKVRSKKSQSDITRLLQ